MKTLMIAVSKLVQKLLNLFGKGTSFPGKLALRFDKDILSHFEMPKITIFVTGTTGKTSVAGTLYEIYKNSYKTVSNIKGSNLIAGVVTAFIEASYCSGKTKVDVLIVEIDERYVKEVFKYITPTYFVINNLSRDQLARNGHYELVFNEINKSIKSNTHLVLNADDPLVTQFSLNKDNEITYYGLKENRYSAKKNKLNTLDISYCPICHKKLKFDYFNYGNLGNYTCPSGDFKRPDPLFEGELKGNKLLVDSKTIELNNDALYNVYNTLACYTVAKISGLEEQIIVDELNKLSLQVKRLTTFQTNGVEGTILLSKNETPLSYNQSLEYVKKKKGKKTVAIGFTRISGRYDLKDISWLYDINFELLNDKEIKRIILIGPFAYDLASRLKQANVDSKKFKYCLDYENSLDYLLENTFGHLYCIVYFDLDYKYLGILKKRGIL